MDNNTDQVEAIVDESQISLERLTRDALAAASEDLAQLIGRAQEERQRLVDASYQVKSSANVVMPDGQAQSVDLDQRVQQLDGWVAHRLEEVKDAEGRLRGGLNHMERLESKVGLLLTQLSGVIKRIKPADAQGKQIKEQMWQYLADVFYDAKNQVDEITQPLEQRVSLLRDREEKLTAAMGKISQNAIAQVKTNQETFTQISSRYKELLEHYQQEVDTDIQSLQGRYSKCLTQTQTNAKQALDETCEDLSRKLSLNQEKIGVNLETVRREIDRQVGDIETQTADLLLRFESYISDLLSKHGTTAEQRLEKASTLFLGRFKHVEHQISLAADEKSEMLTALIADFEKTLSSAREDFVVYNKGLTDRVSQAHHELEDTAQNRMHAIAQELDALNNRGLQIELDLRSRGDKLKQIMDDAEQFGQRLMQVNGEQVRHVVEELEAAAQKLEVQMRASRQRMYEGHLADVERLTLDFKENLEQGEQEIARRVTEHSEFCEKQAAAVNTQAQRVRSRVDEQLTEMLQRHHQSVENTSQEMEQRSQDIGKLLKDKSAAYCDHLDRIEANAQQQFEIRHERLNDGVAKFGELAQSKLQSRLSQYDEQSRRVELEADRQIERRLGDYRHQIDQVQVEVGQDFDRQLLRISEQVSQGTVRFSEVARQEIEKFTQSIAEEIHSKDGVLNEQMNQLRDKVINAIDHLEERLNENITLMAPRSEEVFQRIEHEAQTRLDTIHKKAYNSVDELEQRLDQRVIELNQSIDTRFETSQQMLEDQAQVIQSKGQAVLQAMQEKFDTSVKSMQQDASVAASAATEKIEQVYEQFARFVGQDELDHQRAPVEKLEAILGRAEQLAQRLERVSMRADAAGISNALLGTNTDHTNITEAASGRIILDNMKDVAKRLRHETDQTLNTSGQASNGSSINNNNSTNNKNANNNDAA